MDISVTRTINKDDQEDISLVHPLPRNISRNIRSHNFIEQMLAAEDMAMLELRFLAEIDEIMKDETIEDKHRATAAVVFQVDMEDVTAAMRRRGKAINLGLAYHIPLEVLARVANGENVE